MYAPVTGTSDLQAVGAAEVDFTVVMAPGKVYMLVSTTAAYIKQGTAPVAAAAADGSFLIAANVTYYIDGDLGPTLSIIQAAAGGSATLCLARRLG